MAPLVARTPSADQDRGIPLNTNGVTEIARGNMMGHRVLLIEDNEQNRYLTTFLLEAQGFEVVCATDGLRGIELAESVRPDIILLDIQLPGLDGYGVARALRELEVLDGTPIIAVTSYAMTGDREKALASGCNGYLEKPIDPDTFVASMVELAGAFAERRGAGS